MYRGKKNQPSNRTRILECIFRNAPVARSEIAEMTEITPAAVTTIVAGLIGEHIVIESEEPLPDESSTGRRKVPIDILPSAFYSIGAEFTQKALVVCLTDLKGTIIQCVSSPYSDCLAREITTRLIEGIQTVVAQSKISWEQIVGVGIAVPGHINSDSDDLITNRKTWSHFSPKELEKHIPLPVAYENNARCMALSQYLFRPAGSPDSFASFHVGLGMFCASVVDGDIFLGNNYMAGEIGHTIVNENGRRCECGKYGCLQTYASETWLLKNARLVYQNAPDTLLRNLAAKEDEITIETVITAYSMGDPFISKYIRDALKYLGITASNIAITMNPGKFFLHGQYLDNDMIRSELLDYIDRQLLFIGRTYTSNIEILPYHPEDGAVGASALAVRNFFIN